MSVSTARVLLVEPDAPLAEALRDGARTGLVIEDAPRPDDALDTLERHHGEVAALVLSPRLPDPVAFAQRAHSLDRDLAIVIVATPDDLPALARALQFAPFLGPDVTCRPTDLGPLLREELAGAAERTQRRRSFRRTLAAADEQVAAAESAPAAAVRYGGQLLDEAPVGVVVVDARDRVFGWNRRAAELFERSERQVLGRPLASAVAVEPREGPAKLAARARARETSRETFEDARGRIFDVSASRLRAAREGGVMLVLQEITDRVVAEREREAARADLEFLLEVAATLAVETELDAMLARIARLAVPVLADWCIVDLLAGTTVRQAATHAADPGKLEALHELRERYPVLEGSGQPAAQAIRTASTFFAAELTAEAISAMVRDERHLRLIEELAPKSVIAVPLIARRHVLGALTIVRSSGSPRFSERECRLAEQVAERIALAVDNVRLLAAAEERAQAALVLDAVDDGVFFVDRHGIVRLWNAGAAQLTGVPAADVVGKRVEEALPGWLGVRERVPRSRAGSGRAARAQVLPLQLAAREIWIAVSGVDVPQGTVYAFRDESESVRLQQLQSDFVATVSHELRTPLASVYGAAMTLRRDDVRITPERRDVLLDVISEESDRLALIIDDILLASRVDAGSLTVTEQGVDVVAVARAVVDTWAARAPGHVLRLDVPEGAEHRAVADPDRLRQVLSNLVENAVKYSPEGTEVVVATGRAGRRVRAWVHDRGPGIEPQERERIFEKFYRLDPEQRHGVGGTGLGLYISRELVRLMGGRMGVEPREGGGSSFFVELRAAG